MTGIASAFPSPTAPIAAVFDGVVLAGACNMAPAHKGPGHPLEVLIGRSAALCIHPLAAWRSPLRSDRALLLISYFAVSYAVVFGLLHAFAMTVV